MKFRKRPVVIDAEQFLDNGDAIARISEMAGKDIAVSYLDPDAPVLRIVTLEGTMTADVGDWIIKGVKNELYPCKDDIFKLTYEAEGERA